MEFQNMNKEETDRFDQYNANQMLIARTAVPALILINSASFLALLNNVDVITDTKHLSPLIKSATLWGFGAISGILVWLFSYLNALSLTESLKDTSGEWAYKAVYVFLWLAVLMAVASIGFFAMGVWVMTEITLEV